MKRPKNLNKSDLETFKMGFCLRSITEKQINKLSKVKIILVFY